MTPKHFRRARRLCSRRWYLRFREYKFLRLFKRCDKKLLSANPYELDELSENMTRYAAKMAWYTNKLK